MMMYLIVVSPTEEVTVLFIGCVVSACLRPCMVCHTHTHTHAVACLASCMKLQTSFNRLVLFHNRLCEMFLRNRTRVCRFSVYSLSRCDLSGSNRWCAQPLPSQNDSGARPLWIFNVPHVASYQRNSSTGS